MSSVIIKGIESEGPGDIVGAFANRANIDPEKIGQIKIDESEAIVEIEDGVIDQVIEKIDEKKIGDSRVSVRRLDENLIEYTQKYKDLVEMERKEEIRRHRKEIETLSGYERQKKGRAILNMKGKDEGEGLAGYKIKFVKEKKGEKIPEVEISVGDLIMVSKKDPLRDDNPTGTVIEKTNYSITVSFDEKPQDFVFGKNLRVDLYVNDITFQRMKEALKKLKNNSENKSKNGSKCKNKNLDHISDIIIGKKDPENPKPSKIKNWQNKELNQYQKRAVKRAVNSEDFHLIHGPPGTGKTTTAIEIIQQCIENGDSILATAASNTAVDNIVEFLAEREVDVVRIGHPARVTQSLRNHTLDRLIEENEKYRRSREIQDSAFNLLDKKKDLTAPSGKWRRGMSDKKIKKLAEENKSSRGVPPDKIKEMAEWIQIQEKADNLFSKAENLKKEAIGEIIESSEVVCTTNSTAGSDILEDKQFDTLIIDESTQATEPSCLIPIVKSHRIIMLGDHKQLPPTVKSEKAAKKGLKESLFERLAKDFGYIKDILRTQYRMNKNIMHFPSKKFYGGKLRAHESVKNHTLSDMIDIKDSADILDLDSNLKESVLFIDTKDTKSKEKSRKDSTSKENPFEAKLAEKIIRGYIDLGLDAKSIAVISPYEDQVDRIERKIDIKNLEVDTVDGFQGREKELILISLVRSNNREEIGFLKNERRFNVSITRARRKLIVIGDSTTVGNHEIYRDFINYVRENGRKVTL